MATAPDAGFRLGIDFGTSHTTAILRWPDGHARPLLFDGSPMLPSAVFVEADGSLLVGRDAIHAARLDPARFEPTPKRRIQDGGGAPELTAMAAAVLERVRTEAERVSTVAAAAMTLTLTHPAGWDAPRTGVLLAAARAAGLPDARLVPEPVAAAGYFVAVLGRTIPAGSALVVYDFGGGTFDASVVVPGDGGTGYEVLALGGRTDIGGVDIDAALLRHVAAVHRDADPDAWRRLEEPQTAADRRHRRHLIEDVRAAKEMLSRAQSATVPIPVLELEARVSRSEFNEVAGPLIDQTVQTTVQVVQSAGVAVAAVLLVGGSSRIPLVADRLRQALHIEPSTIDQPETVVAEGSIRLAEGGSGDTRPGSALPGPGRPDPSAGSPREPTTQAQPIPVLAAVVPVSGGPAAQPVDPWAAADREPLAATLVGGPPVPAPPPVQPRLPPPQRLEAPRPAPPRPVAPAARAYPGRRRRRWPVVLGVLVAVLAVGAATAYAIPYLTATASGPPSSGPGSATGTRTPVPRLDPPSWVPAGWTKFADDGERAIVVAGAANQAGGECTYPSAGALHVTRAEFGVLGCHMDDTVRAYLGADTAIEAEFAVVAGCGGMWARTGVAGYFVAVCSDGTVTLHRLQGDPPPSVETQLGPYWRPGFNKQRVLVGLLVQGSTLTVSIDGVAQPPITDEAITRGRVAVGGFGPHPQDRVDVSITRFRAWHPAA